MNQLTYLEGFRSTVRRYPDREAIVTTDGRSFTYAELDERTDALAAALEERAPGERVAVVAHNGVGVVESMLAAQKRGRANVQLSTRGAAGELASMMETADAAGVMFSDGLADAGAALTERMDLEVVVGIGEEAAAVDGAESYEAMLAEADPAAAPEEPATDPAESAIFFTSGTTSKPKGVLHGHGKGINPCPAAYMEHNRDILGKAIFWSPSDWVWIAGFANAIVPAFHYGRPLVAEPKSKFDPEHAFELMAEFDVTDTLITATALQKMRSVERPTERYDLSLDVIHSGGEEVTADLYEWVAETFDDVPLVQGYGLTEAQPIVVNCPDWFEPLPGTIGKPVPGYDVAIIDPETGERLPPGEEGMIAVKDDGEPGLFLEYIDDPEKTQEAYLDDWLLSGDLATRDQDGYYWFDSRDDDVIITSGYRVGPAEVEAALAAHEAVRMAGVVGKPDQTRNEIIKAFVELEADVDPGSVTEADLQAFVRDRLAAYEYPREIEFADIPMRQSSKVDYEALRQRVREEVD